MRERYVEILGKEAAIEAAKERNFGKVELVKENKSIVVDDLHISNKAITKKVEGLSKEENDFFYKIFHKEFSDMLKKGVHKLTRKEILKAGVPTKWK